MIENILYSFRLFADCTNDEVEVSNVANAAKDMTLSQTCEGEQSFCCKRVDYCGKGRRNLSKRLFNSILIHVIVNLHHSWHT